MPPCSTLAASGRLIYDAGKNVGVLIVEKGPGVVDWTIDTAADAVKFTKAGRIEVRLLMGMAKEEGIAVQVDVEDTGVGLTEEQKAKIFHPFSQRKIICCLCVGVNSKVNSIGSAVKQLISINNNSQFSGITFRNGKSFEKFFYNNAFR